MLCSAAGKITARAWPKVMQPTAEFMASISHLRADCRRIGISSENLRSYRIWNNSYLNCNIVYVQMTFNFSAR